MKILMVIPYFTPATSYGGPIPVCHLMGKALVEMGHSVTVVTTDALDSKSRIKVLHETIDGMRVIRFRNISNWAAKYLNLYLPLGFQRWINKNIHSFDVVHCHDFFTLLNVIAVSAGKKASVPCIIQPHGTLNSIGRRSKFSFAKTFFLNFFPFVLNDSTTIIALTKKEQTEIEALDLRLKPKIRIIHNSIDPIEFKNVSKLNLCQKYQIPKDAKTISFLGRLHYIKGVDIAIEVISKIKTKDDFYFLIIGPDEGEQEKLKNLSKQLGVEKNVIFTGILSGIEKLRTLKATDIFLSLSRSEGFPMVLLEAAALNLPIVCSKECNLPEVQTLGAGFVVNSKKEAIEKVAELLNNDKLRESYSQKTSQLSEFFSLKKSMDKLTKIYSSISK